MERFGKRANTEIRPVKITTNFTKYAAGSVLIEMGEKSADNLIKAIEKSKSNDLWILINVLGIRFVGVKCANILASNFSSLDEIMNADGY